MIKLVLSLVVFIGSCSYFIPYSLNFYKIVKCKYNENVNMNEISPKRM